jgi:hypothetical protein
MESLLVVLKVIDWEYNSAVLSATVKDTPSELLTAAKWALEKAAKLEHLKDSQKVHAKAGLKVECVVLMSAVV